MKYRFIIVLPCLLLLAGCAKYWKVTELKETLHFNDHTHQYHDNQQAGYANGVQHQPQHINTVPHPQNTQATAEARHIEDKEHTLIQGVSEDSDEDDEQEDN